MSYVNPRIWPTGYTSRHYWPFIEDENMKIFILLLALLAAMPVTSHADTPDNTELAAVEELGRLNGIALNCRYFDQVKRIKQILIDNLPKRRELGQVFEERTDVSFKEAIQSGAACPSPAAFADDVGKAGDELARIFTSK
jgi:hypothetical protein